MLSWMVLPVVEEVWSLVFGMGASWECRILLLVRIIRNMLSSIVQVKLRRRTTLVVLGGVESVVEDRGLALPLGGGGWYSERL